MELCAVCAETVELTWPVAVARVVVSWLRVELCVLVSVAVTVEVPVVVLVTVLPVTVEVVPVELELFVDDAVELVSWPAVAVEQTILRGSSVTPPLWQMERATSRTSGCNVSMHLGGG